MSIHDVQNLPVEFDEWLRKRVSEANIEVIPLKGAEEKIRAVPTGATVTITCSPKFGLERTIDHVTAAVSKGYRVVPHLAARMVESEQMLRDFVHRIVDLGVTDLYVVGGDADQPMGKFFDAESILWALTEFDHGLTRLGVGCYPEGHPKIDRHALAEALHRKQEYADYMVSQLCFDPHALVGWLDETRAAGVTLPLRMGLAAPLKAAKLAELSMRIGVGQSLRFLTKQHGIVGNLVLGRHYAPEQLLTDIGPDVMSDLNIEGIHLFSFNQIDTSVSWQQRISGHVSPTPAPYQRNAFVPTTEHKKGSDT
ncbi:MAG: methylenetetrahydrofolate reductase [Mycobacterium sp.]|jgi:methylenetetrahydrofolate reductase (NADPH)|uniref:methylenetetrahydrofolate reductase n=1 Tax=Mycobacterium sp. TaxID=1785 RepID=UPI0028B3CEA1|nr:methylenetetrahydrofolate reductase [Mycobacterium sp.]